MATRVLHNICYGGFGFSDEFEAYLKSVNYDIENRWGLKFRSDPTLIAHVEAFGIERAAGKYAKLSIAIVPEFYTFYWNEYDGIEGVICEFPWEQLARALLNNDESDPVLKAVRDETLVLPKKFKSV
jgi:hypothetical protein